MAGTTLIAEIAVFLPLDHTLHYLVPRVLGGTIKPGQRVLVPVRRRKLVGGLVMSVSSSIPSDMPVSLEDLKPITALIDDVPVLPGKMIPFIRWLSSYYFYPVGETANVVLPAGLRVVTSLKLVVTEKGLASVGKGVLSETEEKIITTILDLGNPTVSRLVRALEIPNCFKYINRMRQKEYITTLETVKKEKHQGKTIKFVIARTNNPDFSGIKSEKPGKLWALISNNPGGIRLAELTRQIPNAYYWVKKLEKQGIVTVETRKVAETIFDEEDLDKSAKRIVPTDAQQKIIDEVSKRIIDRSYQVFLLHGVTGSGKTEVYNNLVGAAINRGRQVLLLVPEIALSTHLERILFNRFGANVAVLHSGLTPRERFTQWKGILEGRFNIVVGARSGVFAPLDKLGLIIVDEEQDSSFKQDSGLRYHGRDTAIVRAKMENIPIVLGSATPSLESYHNALLGKYRLLELPERIHKRSLPQVEIIDMRREGRKTTIFSRKLLEEINETLNRKEQVLLFLNRRGFATFLICVVCGEVVKCSRCSISMTYHKRTHDLRCHYCGLARPVVEKCEKCGNPTVKFYGFGTEKIEEEYRKNFPKTRTRRLDSDSVRKRRSFRKIFREVRENKINALIGTQMLAKGHDFPGITLVGVVSADTTLQLPDFRASETTFQLLTQVAGRAGRGQHPGKVLIQTYNPYHYVFHYVRDHDYKGFAMEELKLRKQLNYPPYCRLTRILVTGDSDRKVKDTAKRIASEGIGLIKKSSEFSAVNILGPAEAPLYLVKNQFRWHLFLRAPGAKELQKFARTLLAALSGRRKPRAVKVVVDADPVDVM